MESQAWLTQILLLVTCYLIVNDESVFPVIWLVSSWAAGRIWSDPLKLSEVAMAIKGEPASRYR